MSDETAERPINPERDPRWNSEPGIVRNPESNYSKELAKFEQFHNSYTGSAGPGNAYKYRPYPKMLYRAQRWEGRIACMAAPPDPVNFKDPRDFERAEAAALKFTVSCQRTVNNEVEQSEAMNSRECWREGPAEAVEAFQAADREVALAEAHRLHEDRNMGEVARREAEEARAAVGGEHLGEVPEKRRGRPRKTQPAA